jgi:hypothetical protein
MIAREQALTAITGHAFTNRLAKVAKITHGKGIEAGFAVYSKPSGSKSSAVIHGSSSELQSAYEAFKSAYTELNMTNLLFEAIDPQQPLRERVRKDILSVVHSHPAEHIKPAYMLAPSLLDLELLEKVEVASPGVIKGIVVVEKDFALGSLLLYRRKHPGLPNYYQRFDEDPPVAEILEAMHDSGVATATLEFTPETGNYQADAQAVEQSISSLFA